MTATAGNEPGGGLADATAETVVRVTVVVGLLVDGLSRPEIVAEARERWGLAPRSADRLIAAARAELVEAWALQREQLLAVLLSRTDAVFSAAMRNGNHGAALGAINAAARLAQL